MPRSYSRSPSRLGKGDRKEKFSARRRSRSKSRDYEKYRRKESDQHRRRDRSKSRSVASSTSYAKTSSYRSRSRERKYKKTSRKTSRDHYRSHKSKDRDRHRRTSSSSSSSSSSSTSSSSSRSSGSDSSSQSSKQSSPTKQATESPEKEYVFKSLEATFEEPLDKSTKLQKLNADEFVPQTFVSSRKTVASSSTVSTNIVIDLETQIIKVPTIDKPVLEEDPIFHPTFFPGDDCERMARWVKKLHNLRQTLV